MDTDLKHQVLGELMYHAEKTTTGMALDCAAEQIAMLETEDKRLRLIERRARVVVDFIYEHGWQKIMADGRLNETMFGNLFMLRDALAGKPTYPEEVE